MSFWGSSFSFGSVECEQFGLMVYHIGDDADEETELASTVTIVDEVVANRWKPHFLGTRFEKKLELTMTFGVNEQRIAQRHFLDRHEVNDIAAWLTGHTKYMPLEIEQDDMHYTRYKCIITSLAIVSFGSIPWALRATMTCDSPYGYMMPQTFCYAIDGKRDITLYNESCLHVPYKPKMTIETSGSSFTIVNHTDKERAFSLSGMNLGNVHIDVDNDLCLLTCDKGVNLYPFFNLQFLRLQRGFNQLTVTGNGQLKILCEFPINTGG